MENITKKPVKKFFVGDVTAAIWENEGKSGKFHNVTLTRRYKDGDAIKDTSSLGKYDLTKAIQVLARSLSWIDYVETHGSEPEEAA